MLEAIQAYLSRIRISDESLILIFNTALLILAVVVARKVSASFISRSVRSNELRRKWLVQSRNGLIFLLLIGLMTCALPISLWPCLWLPLQWPL